MEGTTPDRGPGVTGAVRAQPHRPRSTLVPQGCTDWPSSERVDRTRSTRVNDRISDLLCYGYPRIGLCTGTVYTGWYRCKSRYAQGHGAARFAPQNHHRVVSQEYTTVLANRMQIPHQRNTADAASNGGGF